MLKIQPRNCKRQATPEQDITNSHLAQRCQHQHLHIAFHRITAMATPSEVTVHNLNGNWQLVCSLHSGLDI